MISIQSIQDKKAIIAIIGLGYVGLPLAVEFAMQGFFVIGVDNDEEKIRALLEGRNYIQDVEDVTLLELVSKGRLQAQKGYASLVDADIVIICVPTPLKKTREPDMAYIIEAVEGIAEHVSKDCLVVLESTTYPRTTEEVIAPILEEQRSHFYVAFSPERIDPGNPQFKIKNIPKIVGGLDEKSQELAVYLYQQIVETVVPVSSPRVAETAKLLENTFRTVNIGLINEMALMCNSMDIDIWEVIDAAATKPFGFMPFYPGPGLGGHCLPVDPLYLAWKAKFHNFETRFIHLASEVNRSMPHYVVERIANILNDDCQSLNGARILVLGVAYKNDVNDLRESPALDVINILEEKGVKVSYADPHVPLLDLPKTKLMSIALTPEVIKAFDCVVIVTAHNQFDYEMIVAHAKAVMDTRNATRGMALEGKRVYKL